MLAAIICMDEDGLKSLMASWRAEVALSWCIVATSPMDMCWYEMALIACLVAMADEVSSFRLSLTSSS